MFRKVFLVLILVGIFTIFIGCSEGKNIENEDKIVLKKNEEKIIPNQTAQKKLTEIKDSVIPNFEEMYNNTVEIDIVFDSEIVTFNSDSNFTERI